MQEEGLSSERSGSSFTVRDESTGEISCEVGGHEFQVKPARSLCDASPAMFSCSDLDVESVVLDLTRDCLLFFFGQQKMT